MDRKILLLASLLLATLLLPACAGLQPSGASPANAGAPQPATNVAQTVGGDQAAVPGQAYGGHNYWYFASTGAAEIQARILAIAEKGSWTPEQLQAALAATNGSPETVTISVGGNVTGGNADNAGAGSGGASGLSGTSGTVTR